MNRVENALAHATETKALRIGAGILPQSGDMFRELFPGNGCHHSRPDDAAGGGQRCTGQSRGRRRGTGPAAYFHLAGPARRVGIRRRTRCRTATNRCHSRSRGIGNDQRPGKTLLAPQRPPLHGRRHRRLDGRLHVVRRVDHLRRGQADLLVPLRWAYWPIPR